MGESQRREKRRIEEEEIEKRRREDEERMKQHYSRRVKEVNTRPQETEELVNIEKTEEEEDERVRLECERESEDLRKTELRIKELQSSIISLDWQLERRSIEKMKKKTETVQKRMSLSTEHWDFA